VIATATATVTLTAKIDQIDASDLGVEVADLLQRAWAPPCLWYSPEYLRWEFSGPGPRAAIALSAFERVSAATGARTGANRGRMIGFIGAVRRRARIGDWIGDVWLLSFLAVLPEHRRRGIGRRLYADFFAIAHETPVVIFTRRDTPGDFLRRACLPQASELRACRTYGYTGGGPIAASTDDSYTVEPVTDHETWMNLLAARAPRSDRLIAWPDAPAFAHSRQDPRGRTFHVVRDANGRLIAGAAAFHQETRTAEGVSRTPSLECVVTHDARPSTLVTLIRHAAVEGVATATTTPSPRIVLLPNVSTIDETILRPAGLRATRSEFLAHLAGPADHPALAAASTNIEVV
jgi:GNAT superfamily N-acetyltransferase